MKPALFLVLLALRLGDKVSCQRTTQKDDAVTLTSTADSGGQSGEHQDSSTEIRTSGKAGTSTGTPVVLNTADLAKSLPAGTVFLHQKVPHEGTLVNLNKTQGSLALANDILVAPQTRVRRHTDHGAKRVVESTFKAYWTNAIIPFVWDPSLTPDGKDSTIGSMDVISRYTCIRFVQLTPTTSTDYNLRHNGALLFLPGGNCGSFVGRASGNQTVYCCDDSVCVHELGHAVGLQHEQKNPLRIGHVRVNWPYLPQAIQGEYILKTDPNLNGFYDPSSPMHYPDWWGPFTMLFPDSEFLDHKPFYMMREISLLYQCAAKNCTTPPQCDFEGYAKPKPGTWNGTCVCQCHDGLDPDTGCTSVAPKVVVSGFPGGNWAMLAPDEGCPVGANLDTGSLISYYLSTSSTPPFYLQGQVGGGMAELHFCVSQNPDNQVTWPKGEYCYLAKNGCPTDFNAGYIQMENEYQASGQQTTSQGSLPDGQFTQNVLLQFCCRSDGVVDVPMALANTQPFALFSESSSGCQAVSGMYVENLRFTITSRKSGIFSMSSDPRSLPQIDIVDTSTTKQLGFHYCKYFPVRKDCGEVIELDSSRPVYAFTSPHYPSNYDNLAECFYTIRSPENTTILLSFHDFDIEGSATFCNDTVQVKQAKLGWNAKSYCGSTMDATFRSTENTMQVILRTDEAGQRRGFSATVSYIAWADNCYKEDGQGKNYRGTINFTKTFKRCLPWNTTTSCPHHSLRPDNAGDGLVSNYCRNPGDGLHPWCYTDLNGCARDYCDVCLWGRPYDAMDGCASFKSQGQCTQNIALSRQNCALTCSDQLPPLTPPPPFSQQSCLTPPAPLDARPVTSLQDRYAVDDEVTFQCLFNNNDNVTARCLSDGTWSASGYVCGQCPQGWIPFSQGSMGPGCLIFFNDYYLPYSSAVLRCSYYGAVLAEPRTQDAANFLAYGKNTGEPVWIGLTKDAKGDLRWQDGSVSTFSKWLSGQPDNSTDKKCVVVDTTMSWSTVFCNATYHATCFRPQLQCPFGYRYYENGLGCIRASDGAKMFDIAEQECRAEGGLVARVPLPAAVSYFANWRTGQTDFWVNIKNVTTGGGWSLRDSRGQLAPYAGDRHCHQGKRGHKLSPNIANGKCTRISTSSGNQWLSSLCNNTYQFFCERPKVQCPFGFVALSSENNITECYLNTDMRLNISLAAAQCNSLGGIVSESKTVKANSLLSNFRGDGISLWIGLKYNASVSNWMWSDGSISTNQTWKGKPSGYHLSGQDCATIQTGSWTSRTCASVYYFFCSKPLECPDGFAAYLSGKGCYWKSDQKLSYQDAVSTCKSKGAIVAEPREDVANQFFGSLWPGNEPHIGLVKRSNGLWVWQDGSNTSVYSNYLTGRPYTGDVTRNCTSTSQTLGWQDSSCSDLRYFACTRDQTPKKICADYTPDCKVWVNDIPNFCSLPDKYYMAYYVCPFTCGVCRRPCPNGYTQLGYNRDCYRYYSDARTYADSQSQCTADGAILYPAKNATELLFLSSLNQNNSGVWVGLTDSDTEGTWKYSDGTLMTDSSLWATGEPDNAYQGVSPCNCAGISQPGNLVDYPCDQTQTFVCKKPYDAM